jgi:hypothetical protein
MNVIGIDAGSTKSGVAIVSEGRVERGMVISNTDLCKMIKDSKYSTYLFVIEDLRAYSVRLSQDLINTAKFIGKLEYMLQDLGYSPVMVERVQIKKMVYDKYPSAPKEVRKMIEQRGKVNKMGDFRKPSMIYVCDRVVANAMRYFWELPKGQGKRNKLGLASHSWQALALCSHQLFSSQPQ